MKRLIPGLWLVVATCAGCQSLSTPNLSLSSMALPRLEMPALPTHSSPEATVPDLPRQKEIELHSTMAKEMEKAGHDREAIHCYEKLRALDAKTPGLSWKLGVLYARQEEFDKSATEFRKALDIEPPNSDLLNDVGYGSYQAGKWEEAEGWFRKALELNPQNTRAQVNLGLAVGQQGKFQAAFDLFRPVIGEANAHHNVGILYMVQKRPEEAKTHLCRALALDPSMSVTKATLEKLAKPTTPKPDTVVAKAPPAAPKEQVLQQATWLTPPPSLAPVTAEVTRVGEGAPQWKPVGNELPINVEPKRVQRSLRLSAPVPVAPPATTDGNTARKPLLGTPVAMAQ